MALLGKTQFGEGSGRQRISPRGGVPPSICKVHATYVPKHLKCSWALNPHFLSGRSSFNLCLGLPLCSAGKESACNVGDPGSIPGLGRSPGEGKGYPLQYSGPREFCGLYSPWGCKELDMTERLTFTTFQEIYMYFNQMAF